MASSPSPEVTGSDDDDDLTAEHRKEADVVLRNRVKLTEYIHDPTVLFPYMKEKYIFSVNDCEIIRKEQTPSNQVDKFIDILMTKGPKATGVFHESLAQHYIHLFNYLSKLFSDANIELPPSRQALNSIAEEDEIQFANSSRTMPSGSQGVIWQRVHSRKVRQSLDYLTRQIEKIQIERDAFRDILGQREAQVADLLQTSIAVTDYNEGLKKELNALRDYFTKESEADARRLRELKGQKEELQKEYEKLDTEFMLTSLELIAARDRIQKLIYQLNRSEQENALIQEANENLQSTLFFKEGELQRLQRKFRRRGHPLERPTNATKKPFIDNENRVIELIECLHAARIERQEAIEERDILKKKVYELNQLCKSQATKIPPQGAATLRTISAPSNSPRPSSSCSPHIEVAEGMNSHFQSNSNLTLKEFTFEVEPEIAQGLHLKAGVYISQIEDDFMLKAGDILTQINAIKIGSDSNPLDFSQKILASATSSSVLVSVLRAAQQRATTAEGTSTHYSQYLSLKHFSSNEDTISCHHELSDSVRKNVFPPIFSSKLTPPVLHHKLTHSAPTSPTTFDTKYSFQESHYYSDPSDSDELEEPSFKCFSSTKQKGSHISSLEGIRSRKGTLDGQKLFNVPTLPLGVPKQADPPMVDSPASLTTHYFQGSLDISYRQKKSGNLLNRRSSSWSEQQFCENSHFSQ